MELTLAAALPKGERQKWLVEKLTELGTTRLVPLLTERGVYYYSFSSRNDGWENRIELTKKFTETFSTAIRHEIRRGSPDGTAQDYTRLKLLLGLDF